MMVPAGVLQQQKVGGAPAYDPGMMTFDGSTGHYSGTYTSVGNVVTLVAKFNRAAFTGGGIERMFQATGPTPHIRVAGLLYSSDHATTARRNKLLIQSLNTSGVNVCRLLTIEDVADGADHVLFYEFDGDTGTAIYIMDGVSADDTGWADRVAPTTGNLDAGASSVFRVGTDLTNFYGGKLGYCGMRDVGGLDFNDFMDGSTPKDIEATLNTVWGGGPPLYWKATGKLDENDGNAGNMTANGTITGPA